MGKYENRRSSRSIAVEAIFSYLEREGKKDIKDCLTHSLAVNEKEKDVFAQELTSATLENLAKIKLVLKVFAPEFPYEKIAPINRAILLLGLCEMKFLDTPPVVVINEYIEIAKMYGEKKSASFINGVLDNFRKGLNLDREK